MAKAQDLTGKRFGMLTVLRLSDELYISPGGCKKRQWICQCDCGNTVTVATDLLNSGKCTRGCLLMVRYLVDASALSYSEYIALRNRFDDVAFAADYNVARHVFSVYAPDGKTPADLIQLPAGVTFQKVTWPIP